MAKLFGKNKLKDQAKLVSTDEIRGFLPLVEAWQRDYHTGTLRNDNETAREQAYNQTFFKDILGYSEKPADPYSFQPKASTELRGIPDATIGHFETEGNHKNFAAVVELKGADINLDRPQRREGNLSPVQQGFKYKSMHRSVPFVVVSNFWEFRLYNDNQLDYEVWTLDDLVNPADDYLAFKSWYVLLHKRNFTAHQGQSATERLLSDIRVQQLEVGKEFYREYKAARLALIAEIQLFNSGYADELDFVITKAQKIIDRVIFAAFAEDKGLLPDDTLRRLKREVQSSTFTRLWPTLIQFFKSIDKGDPRLEIPEGYNGGLFADDDELNRLTLGEQALGGVLNLSGYNFNEELSVTILGHIFEQSITDIEHMKSGADAPGSSRNRRKKDGIFYTPDYIVRYIVENSLGVYLREHEDRFRTEARLHEGIQDATYARREHEAYVAYYEFLRNIKVVDPACGSGAFLVYVFDYLLAEHERVGAILGYATGAASFEQVYRNILRNNIYGVDLNEESVEIAKLSLWLKTALKGKKLTSLDQNIKVGNSLIDDPMIAGDKAFNWQEQFSEVFAQGGFDVVVGNPPYVDSETMVKNMPFEREYLSQKFESASGNWDLLVPFIEQGLNLTKDGGFLSMITSNKWLSLAYGEKIREILLPHLYAALDLTPEKVFESANVSSAIFIVRKSLVDSVRIDLLTEEEGILAGTCLDKSADAVRETLTANLGAAFSPWLPVLVAVKTRLATIRDSGFTVVSAATTAEAYELAPLIYESPRVTPGEFKLINTGTVWRHATLWGISDFTYLKHKYRYPVVAKGAFATQFPRRFARLNTPKIVITGIRNFRCFLDLENNYLPTKSTTVVISEPDNLSWLTPVLNSRFMAWYIHANYFSSSMAGGINFTPDLISDLPLPNIPNEQRLVLSSLGSCQSRHSSKILSDLQKFHNLVTTVVAVEKWPPRLIRWWEMEFAEFIKGLRVQLTLDQKEDLLEIFEKYRDELASLDTEIQRLDREIDQLVYQLYDLTPEEITLVEESA